jgi:sulfur-carrier protein
VRLVYFASVREAIDLEGEERDLPACVMTVADCLNWLEGQGAQYGAAFANRSKLRFALDQKMASSDAPLTDTSELAIFPPVTGG